VPPTVSNVGSVMFLFASVSLVNDTDPEKGPITSADAVTAVKAVNRAIPAATAISLDNACMTVSLMKGRTRIKVHKHSNRK
jgi:hypothetical protein